VSQGGAAGSTGDRCQTKRRSAVVARAATEQAILRPRGVPAGERGPDGAYPDDTLHRRVKDRLAAMALAAREWGGGERDGSHRARATPQCAATSPLR
jgi:hypothetical protein